MGTRRLIVIDPEQPKVVFEFEERKNRVKRIISFRRMSWNGN